MQRPVLVDTSAWIEFVRGTRSRVAQALERLLVDDAPIVVTGLVVAELLRGCRDDDEAAQLCDVLAGFPWVEPSYPRTYQHAAELHRRARSRGAAGASTVDCVLAALAIDNRLAVLHRDRDFDQLARVSELVVARP